MKKKILTITLVDGRTIKRDLTNEITGVPFGAPANDPSYAMLCAQISANGYTDMENTSAENYTHIAPSQIKSVSFSII